MNDPTPDFDITFNIKDGDPRYACWFDGNPAVALAPRHSGGDETVPAHWVPTCQHHVTHWHDDVDPADRMPIIPLNRD